MFVFRRYADIGWRLFLRIHTTQKTSPYIFFSSVTQITQISTLISLQWWHANYDRVSNHQPHGCLFNRLFSRTSKKTSKLRVTRLCVGNTPATGQFPAQRAINRPLTQIMSTFGDVIMSLDIFPLINYLACTFFVFLDVDCFFFCFYIMVYAGLGGIAR